MEMFGGLVKSFSKTTDEYYLSATVKDVNDFFDQEMTFLQTYHHNLKEATTRADRQTTKHKDVADSYIKISTNLLQLATTDTGKLERFLTKIAETFEKLRVRIHSEMFFGLLRRMNRLTSTTKDIAVTYNCFFSFCTESGRTCCIR